MSRFGKQFDDALDRHITGNYGEKQFEHEGLVLERGFKPVKKGTKCSYKNCLKDAICYKFGGQGGWNVCETHGGKKVTKEEKF